jgi:hypothetical protein
MRKTMIAIAIGLTALAAAACNNDGGTVDSSPLDTMAPLESIGPLESDGLESMDPLESPLESPASS